MGSIAGGARTMDSHVVAQSERELRVGLFGVLQQRHAVLLDQRAELPALVGLFCFYQYLSASPPKSGASSGKGPDVDKKLYGAVWGLCKRVPLVYLGGVAMWRRGLRGVA